MERTNALELIRAKCIEANADIEIEAVCKTCDHEENSHRFRYALRAECIEYTCSCPEFKVSAQPNYRPIRLADVLLAIPLTEGKTWRVTQNGVFVSVEDEWGIETFSEEQWNLHKDDLTEQSDDTINFLANLLTDGH